MVDRQWIERNVPHPIGFTVKVPAILQYLKEWYTGQLHVDSYVKANIWHQDGHLRISAASLCPPCPCSSHWSPPYQSCYNWLVSHEEFLNSSSGKRWLLSKGAQEFLRSSWFYVWAYLTDWYAKMLTSTNPSLEKLAQKLLKERPVFFLQSRDFRLLTESIEGQPARSSTSMGTGTSTVAQWRATNKELEIQLGRTLKDWTEADVLAWLVLLPLTYSHPSLNPYTLKIAKALDKVVIPLLKRLKVTGEFLSDDTKVQGLEEEITRRWHPDEVVRSGILHG